MPLSETIEADAFRKIKTEEKCPRCTSLLFEKAYNDFSALAKIYLRMLKESEVVLSKITEAIKDGYQPEEEQSKIKELIPYDYRHPRSVFPSTQIETALTYSLQEWNIYFGALVSERRTILEEHIDCGRNTVILHCEKCGYVENL